ncbi:MAG: DUF2721 domain-containing protein [Bdellovibrionota bacterium]
MAILELTRSFNDIRSFLEIMQATTAPAMIISALAFLLSIMASRYARAIDRTREIIDQLERGSDTLPNKKKRSLHYQLKIIYKRSRQLRTMMAMASLCVFLVVLTIGAVFIGLLYGLHLETFASSTFLLALGTLIGSMVLFVLDIVISLYGIKIEIQEVEKELVS